MVRDLSHIYHILQKGDIALKKGKKYAAVAIIFCGDKIVIERRNSSLKDPWGGQFALPGGHFKPSDLNLLTTVLREVKEETGLDLKADSDYLGYFGRFSPMNDKNLSIFVFVFCVATILPLMQSNETDILKWESIYTLKKNRKVENGNVLFSIEEGKIWGLTARILDFLLSNC